MSEFTIDNHNNVLENSPELLSILLKDHTTGGNIFWATDNYAHLGEGFQFFDQITLDAITGVNSNIIIPRSEKAKNVQKKRSRQMAEIFTPSWVCNKMVNMLDEKWFERTEAFNKEVDDYPNRSHTWLPTENKIEFPDSMTWREYISLNQLEITCGEAPFLVSRYDTVTGEPLPVKMRIGILDRKLRIADENTSTFEEWYNAAIHALKATYGYEWQGDNILLARKNLFYTLLDYHKAKFNTELPPSYYHEIAEIVAWNIWQMDGLKFVVPCSCHDEIIITPRFGAEDEVKKTPCPGCKMKNYHTHNGKYSMIMDWEEGHPIQFVSLTKNNRNK